MRDAHSTKCQQTTTKWDCAVLSVGPLRGFQDRCLKPLSHPSTVGISNIAVAATWNASATLGVSDPKTIRARPWHRHWIMAGPHRSGGRGNTSMIVGFFV